VAIGLLLLVAMGLLLLLLLLLVAMGLLLLVLLPQVKVGLKILTQKRIQQLLLLNQEEVEVHQRRKK
jgi:hypothetical protein